MTAADKPLIVIVDDDAGMRRALVRLVVAAGYRAQAFERVEDTAAAGTWARAECLVLDMRLPGLSASRWYATLWPRPPAVFITTFDSPQARAAAHAAGAAACLSKPFEGRALLEAIGVATKESGRRP